MTTEELSVFCDDLFCGCGSPAKAAGTLLRLLHLHPLYEHYNEFERWVDDTGLQYLLLYWLDSLELTEHGGSVGSAWLTEKGKEVRDALAREEAADDFRSLFEERCVHGYRPGDEHTCT